MAAIDYANVQPQGRHLGFVRTISICAKVEIVPNTIKATGARLGYRALA